MEINSAVISFVGSALGVAFGYAGTTLVTKERLAAEEERGRTRDKRLSEHDSKLERVVYRDSCEKTHVNCMGREQDRYQEILRRIDEMKNRSEGIEKAFRECMDDLVSELRNGPHKG